MDRVGKHVEEVVVKYTSLLIGATTLFAAFLNVFLQLDSILIVFVFIVSAVYFGIYFYVRHVSLTPFVKYFITIFSFLIMNAVWYFNYFSNGPALLNFVLLYAFIVFVWDNKNTAIFTGLIYINLILMFSHEFVQGDKLATYASFQTRLFDVYFGLLLVLVGIHFFTWYAKSSYIKENQSARQSDNLKSAFLANLSHEIRTPLNSIIGFSDLITSPDTSDEERLIYNGIIQSNSNDLLELIENVVDLAMIESDQVKLVKTNFEVNALLQSIYSEFTSILHEGNPVKLTFDKLENPIHIYSDQLRVKQIIKNLVNNAVKYTKAGSIHYGFLPGINSITFFISDTGVGIKNEHLKMIFERFMKLENQTELYRGVGIGLHLSKRIAKLLGGDLWVTSTYGKGSTFYFSLPL